MQLVTIMDETEAILSEIDLLFNEHHEYHGHLGEALKNFNKLQGAQAPTFFRDT